MGGPVGQLMSNYRRTPATECVCMCERRTNSEFHEPIKQFIEFGSSMWLNESNLLNTDYFGLHYDYSSLSRSHLSLLVGCGSSTTVYIEVFQVKYVHETSARAISVTSFCRGCWCRDASRIKVLMNCPSRRRCSFRRLRSLHTHISALWSKWLLRIFVLRSNKRWNESRSVRADSAVSWFHLKNKIIHG